jgi:hypothetical protein
LTFKGFLYPKKFIGVAPERGLGRHLHLKIDDYTLGLSAATETLHGFIGKRTPAHRPLHPIAALI